MQIHVSCISSLLVPSQARNRSSAPPFLARGAREAAGRGRPQQAPRARAQPWRVGVAADREQPNFKELPEVACLRVLLNQSSRRRAAPQPAESRAQSQALGFPHPGHPGCTRRSPHPPATRPRPSPEPAIPACTPGPNDRARLLPITQPVQPAQALLGEVLITHSSKQPPGRTPAPRWGAQKDPGAPHRPALPPFRTKRWRQEARISTSPPLPGCPHRCSLDPLASSPRNPRSPRGALGSALMPRAGRRPPGASPGYTTRHRAAHGHRMPGRSSRPQPWGTLILGSPNPALVLHPFLLPFPARSRQASQRPVPKGLAGCPAQQRSPPAPSAQGINFGL